MLLFVQLPGDNTLPGATTDSRGPKYDLDTMLDGVEGAFPAAAQALRDLVCCGAVNLVEIYDDDVVLGPDGQADANTIGVNTTSIRDPLICGLVLIHELGHVQSARGAGAEQDPNTDDANPCSGCAHAAMYAADLDRMRQIAAELKEDGHPVPPSLCQAFEGASAKGTEFKNACNSVFICAGNDGEPFNAGAKPCGC